MSGIQKNQSSDEGEHRRPAKPPQGTRSQLGESVYPSTGLRLLEIFRLHEIKVIQQIGKFKVKGSENENTNLNDIDNKVTK